MQFVDQAEIMVRGGDGGDGLVAFRHEKFMPRGGPSGGDGGRGGSITLKADTGLSTLVDLRYKKHYKAGRGENGGPNDRHGANGEDLLIRVPVGTVVYESASGRMLADLSVEGQEYVVAKGGAGGKGNARFATSTTQAPHFAEKGEPKDDLAVTLELKLIADVGLIGYPSVGKSTLISKVSAARPKIADYPFTTLIPNLGVVKIEHKSFVVADMPGLIEGAHLGAGLGHQFLRHIERTRLLVHLIDVSGFTERDPMHDFDAINDELKLHSEKLAALSQIIALNKADMPDSAPIVAELRTALEERGYEVHVISALTGLGLQGLLYSIAEKLENLPREALMEDDVVRFSVTPSASYWEARKTAEDVYVVEGKDVEMLVRRTDLSNEYALRRMHKALDKLGVIQRLRELGAKHMDTVRIKDLEFDFSDETGD